MRVAVDFGTCMTKVAILSGDLAPAGTFESFAASICSSPADGTIFAAVPSQVLPSAGEPLPIGCEVTDSGPDAVRWMKHFLIQESPVTLRSGGVALSYRDAASAFLEELLRRVDALFPGIPLDVVFTAPHDAPPSYFRWLTNLAVRSQASSFGFVDEAACAIAGNGVLPSSGDSYLLIDAGGAVLKTSLAVFRGQDSGDTAANPWRIIGTATRDVAASLSPASSHEVLSSALQRTLTAAAVRGLSEETITAVVVAGGCGSDPAVHREVSGRFPGLPVYTGDPLYAAIRGALLLPGSAAGMLYRLRHDYAVRFWNAAAGTYEYRPLIRRGTACPSAGPVARFRIRGAYDGQTQLAIPLFEVGSDKQAGSGIELVGERGGGIRLIESAADGNGVCTYRPLSSEPLLVIPADPPIALGETRFEVILALDAAMGLRASVRDLQTGRLVVKDGLVARLA